MDVLSLSKLWPGADGGDGAPPPLRLARYSAKVSIVIGPVRGSAGARGASAGARGAMGPTVRAAASENSASIFSEGVSAGEVCASHPSTRRSFETDTLIHRRRLRHGPALLLDPKDHGRSPHAAGPGPRPTCLTTEDRPRGCPTHFRFKTWSLAQPFRPRKTRRSSRGRGGAWRSCSSAARASPRRRRTSTVSPLQTRPDPPSATPPFR